jgi:hypothetical protein
MLTVVGTNDNRMLLACFGLNGNLVKEIDL